MPVKRLVVLALAARHGRVGYVLLIDGVPKDWRLSRMASQCSRLATARLEGWIGRYDPDAIVLEDYRSAGRKSRKTQAILKALHRAARKSSAVTVSLTREQNHPNKFAEAAALAERFPDLAAWLPRRPKLWEREPRNLVYFEALALAVQSVFLPDED